MSEGNGEANAREIKNLYNDTYNKWNQEAQKNLKRTKIKRKKVKN